MMIGLLGRKIGMTRVFTAEGVSVPVSVEEVHPNRVSQVKTLETDGYAAIQVTAGSKKANRVNKAEAGHFAKAGVEAGRGLWEFRLENGEEFEVGSQQLVSGTQQLSDIRTSKALIYSHGIANCVLFSACRR